MSIRTTLGEKRGAFSTASKPSSASVALATYWGSAQGLARLTATTVCAVAGAWLGFHVTSAGFGLLAPLLAIIGATAVQT
jgi:hypothetical protein